MKTLNEQEISESGQRIRAQLSDVESGNLQAGDENENACVVAGRPRPLERDDARSEASAGVAASEGWGFVSWDGGGGW